MSFASNGDTAEGYLAVPASGTGPGVLVVQEWWGLVPQIKRVCDRLAAEGFVALAPDLYHGEIAEHTEMDKAAQLMSTLPIDRAARDMARRGRLPACDTTRCRATSVGVVGFCMGGMLTLADRRATGRQDRRRGSLLRRAARRQRARLVEPHRARPRPLRRNRTTSSRPRRSTRSKMKLRKMGKDVKFTVHPGTGPRVRQRGQPPRHARPRPHRRVLEGNRRLLEGPPQLMREASVRGGGRPSQTPRHGGGVEVGP